MDASFFSTLAAWGSCFAAGVSLLQLRSMHKQYDKEHEPKLFPTGSDLSLFDIKDNLEKEEPSSIKMHFINLGMYPAINIIAEWDIPYLGTMNDYINLERVKFKGIRKSSIVSKISYGNYEADAKYIRQEKPRCWPERERNDFLEIYIPKAVLLLLYACNEHYQDVPEMELALSFRNADLKLKVSVYKIHWVHSNEEDSLFNAEFYLDKSI